MFRSLVTIAILAAAPHDIVQSARDCAAVIEQEQRLACYDGLFRTATPERVDAPVDPQIIIDTAVTPQTPSPQDPPPIQQTASEEDFGSETVIEQTKPKKQEVTQIRSRVESITRRLRNQMVFHLANDQTWTQTASRHVTIRVGDKVSIRKMRLGGYKLTNEKGASTKVTRID